MKRRKRHLAEIKEYKAYQQSLPSRLRYENTTVRALKTLKLDRDAARTEALKEKNKMKKTNVLDTYMSVQKSYQNEKDISYSRVFQYKVVIVFTVI